MRKMDFTAIDFETANSDRASACSVGLTRVRGGEVVETVSWLTKPHSSVDHFNRYNTQIHGIWPQDVADAPDWAASLDRIIELNEGHPLVAFNASFDSEVFFQSCEMNGVNVPDDLFFICALELSRQHLTVSKYSLDHVVRALELPEFDHHEAGADALACASVVLEIASRRTFSGDTLQLWDLTGAPRIKLDSPVSTPSRPTNRNAPEANPDADPTHPLFGQHVVFTRELESISRPTAEKEAAARGAIIKAGVTKKTSMVILGGEVARWGEVRSDVTVKERKAREYSLLGQKISFLSEQDFLSLIDRGTQPEALTIAPPLDFEKMSTYRMSGETKAEAVIAELCTAGSGLVRALPADSKVPEPDNGRQVAQPAMVTHALPRDLTAAPAAIRHAQPPAQFLPPLQPMYGAQPTTSDPLRTPVGGVKPWIRVRWWLWFLVYSAAAFVAAVIVSGVVSGVAGAILWLLSWPASLGLLVFWVLAIRQRAMIRRRLRRGNRFG